MNGFTENAASGAPETPGGHDVVLLWSTARRMLPLVRRIVDDILDHNRRLAKLQAEKGRLDRKKRVLDWSDRSLRYRLHEEMTHCEHHLQDAAGELEVLGVVLLDPVEGRIGFPTRVNDARAYFSWRPEDEEIQYWHFASESARRPIPTAWATIDAGRSE